MQFASLTLTAAPTTEPVTIAEVEAHLRLDETSVETAPTAPTVALASPAVAGNIDNGAHRYLVTFVTASGETQAGVASDIVTVADKAVNGKVTVSGIPLGGGAVTQRKLYRTLAGGSSYYLLTTITNNTATTYTDNIADGTLGIGAPTANTTGDPLLSIYIAAARMRAESATGRALVTQSWEMALDEWPDDDEGYTIEIPLPPLQSIDSIHYYDIAGTLTLLDAAQYQVDLSSEPARIAPAYNCYWPDLQEGRLGAVVIAFTAGYALTSDIPTPVRNWILCRTASLNEHREDVAVISRGEIRPLPFLDALLDSYKVYKL
jgi:uncharacterized phiE125 gp8 family phage protein